jgi:hypothetical protein
MKVISYCLWGDDPKYINGLIKNIEIINNKIDILYNLIYLFVPYSEYYKYKKIFCNSVKYFVIPIYTETDLSRLMFYRFIPTSWNDVDVMYSRDLDSPILDREIAAMKEFEESDKMFHIMRDHPFHSSRVLGGTWGAKKGAIPEMEQLVKENLNKFDSINQDDKHFEGWYRDQHFLEQIIYPKIRDKAMIHDSFRLYPDEKGIARDFPTKRESDEFVGMIINADGSRNEESHKILRDAERK